MVERRITGEPTEIDAESITGETPDEELTVENVEMTDDGGAIINPVETPPEDRFDANKKYEVAQITQLCMTLETQQTIYNKYIESFEKGLQEYYQRILDD